MLSGCPGWVSLADVRFLTLQSRKPTESKTSPAVPRPVYRPDDLGLGVITCNEDVVKRCGIEVIYFVNEDDKVVRPLRPCVPLLTDSLLSVQLDYLAFNAIPSDLLDRMMSHFDHFTHMKGLVRGAQFKEYVQGKMVPRGERSPTGGAPGDCHRFYDSMNVDNPMSLNGLFDNAEVRVKNSFTWSVGLHLLLPRTP
jgi:hypothetical protein